MKKKLDDNLDRKEKLLDDHIKKVNRYNDIPVFSLIEINITDKCNRKCEFCPRNNPKLYSNSDYEMSIETYKKIMKDLKKLKYKGTILFSAFCEPLTHSKLNDIIKLTKKYCPRSHLEIISNGDYADEKTLKKLFSSGLDTVLLSLYDGEEQIDKFEDIRKSLKLTKKQMRYRKRYLSKEKDYGIILSNRAGMIDMGPKKVNLKQECLYPFYQLTIDSDGTVLLCPHDWSKTIKFGNVNDSNILDIWNCPSITKIRKRLINKNRGFIPCNKCNVDGKLMGNEHLKEWKVYYEGS